MRVRTEKAASPPNRRREMNKKEGYCRRKRTSYEKRQRHPWSIRSNLIGSREWRFNLREQNSEQGKLICPQCYRSFHLKIQILESMDLELPHYLLICHSCEWVQILTRRVDVIKAEIFYKGA